MPYRRSERVVQKIASRHAAIIAATGALAAEGGMASVQIAPVAERAGIAAGTVYRYFPSKIDLIAALVAAKSEAEIAAVDRAADVAPGPLSALAAAIAVFAARAVANRRLAFALMAEPVEPDLASLRARYRAAVAAALERRIGRAIESGHLPEQDAALAAASLVGGLIEGLVGPLAPAAPALSQVQALTLFMLRGLGLMDARARGLVVQVALPLSQDAT
jgi:AcrR family transcriptional regulator